MRAIVEVNNEEYSIDFGKAIDISIPLDFHGPQPNVYGVNTAAAAACRTGDLVGDTRLGGSCNFEQFTFIPHCNGTHTECVGHITSERINIRNCLRDPFVPSTLVTILPVPAFALEDAGAASTTDADILISRPALEAALHGCDKNFLRGLIIRTLPNSEDKKTLVYGERGSPFFTSGAMELIRELGVDQLVVDFPSIDRLFDEGKMLNHRLYWNVDPGSFNVKSESRLGATITEMAYIENSVSDGNYFLNLQIAPFVADASPSRPLLFRVSA
jgi:arylformamidase